MIIGSISELHFRNTCLDFGSGFGFLLPALSKLFKSVVGLDVDEGQINSSKTLVKKAALPNVSLILKNLENEFDDFQGSSFDCIVADNVLGHIPISNINTILKEF